MEAYDGNVDVYRNHETSLSSREKLSLNVRIYFAASRFLTEKFQFHQKGLKTTVSNMFRHLAI